MKSERSDFSWRVQNFISHYEREKSPWNMDVPEVESEVQRVEGFLKEIYQTNDPTVLHEHILQIENYKKWLKHEFLPEEVTNEQRN